MPAGETPQPDPVLGGLWQQLATLTDPEIPVLSLLDLGVLRGIRWGADGAAEVLITPTYNGCPAMDQIQADVEQALSGCGHRVRVLHQLAPAWTTDWITPVGHAALRAYGIAPPGSRVGAGAQPVRLALPRPGQHLPVPCPRCGSSDTTETSPFGSTACKSQHRCLACLEPFDHFKPH